MPLAYSRCLINGPVSPMFAYHGKTGSSFTLPHCRKDWRYLHMPRLFSGVGITKTTHTTLEARNGNNVLESNTLDWGARDLGSSLDALLLTK